MSYRLLIKSLNIFIAAICITLVSGCSSEVKNIEEDKAEYYDVDPYESLNRKIFAFNLVVDGIILKPVAHGYNYVVPDRGKVMVSNFADNIKEPITFANSILQADIENSFATFWRFLINSSFGIGGLFDVATEIGLNNRETGMGDTFAIYGVGSGPYFVVPVIGPSTTRESFGRLGDLFVDPFSYVDNKIFYSIIAVKTVDTRYHKMSLLDDVYENSLDPYSTLRSLYLQHREVEVQRIKEKRKKTLNEALKESSK